MALELGNLRHVVLVKLKPETPTAELKESANRLKEIPGVLWLDFGENTSDFCEGYQNRSQGFTHTLIVHMKDGETLKNYSPHPIHQEFVQKLRPYKLDLLAMDFYGEAKKTSSL